MARQFKEKLKELRQGAGLTQEQLAARCGMPLGNIRNYEQGIRQPSWPAVVKLSRALGLPADEFSDCIPEDESPAASQAEGQQPHSGKALGRAQRSADEGKVKQPGGRARKRG